MLLTEKDIPFLPPQVTFSTNHVSDLKLGKSYPINEVTFQMLRRVDGRKTIGQIAVEIGQLYTIPVEIALNDLTLFFAELNKAHLLNIRYKSYRYNLKLFFLNLRLFKFKKAVEALTERRRYDFPPNTQGLFQSLCLLTFYILMVFKYNLISLFILLTFIPEWGWYEAGYMTLAFFLSIVVHECSHMCMLYWTKEKDKLGFLGRSYGTVGIFRKYTTPWKEIIISLIGPLAPFVIGVGGFIIGFGYERPLLLFASFFWLAHIVSLFSDDGKNIQRGIQDFIRERSTVL